MRMTESRTTSPFISQPQLVLETILPAPQASSAPQDLVEWLPLERFAFAKQPNRSANELGGSRPLTSGRGVEPSLVRRVE